MVWDEWLYQVRLTPYPSKEGVIADNQQILQEDAASRNRIARLNSGLFGQLCWFCL